MSVVVEHNNRTQMITKGAVEEMLAVCVFPVAVADRFPVHGAGHGVQENLRPKVWAIVVRRL